jgi:hypothetical protein
VGFDVVGEAVGSGDVQIGGHGDVDFGAKRSVTASQACAPVQTSGSTLGFYCPGVPQILTQ